MISKDDERLEKQMDFIRLIDKSKEVYRQTYLTSGSRKENDAEHSWHLAVMAFLLQEYSNEPVDLLRVMQMVLIHDLVEIEAGDTYAYDEAGNASKRQRELEAAEHIFPVLPEDLAAFVRGLWDEFEAAETPEARFANSLDKFQPAVLNDASGGRSWVEHKTSVSQIVNRNGRIEEGADTLWKYEEEILRRHADAGNIIKDREI